MPPSRSLLRRVALPACAALLCVASVGCDRGAASSLASVPPVRSWGRPVLIEGRWSGELDGVAGSLVITRLDGPRLRGLFHGEERMFVLRIERSAADAGGAWLPSNRALVAWIDGHGSEGRGWLLVDAQGRAITGALGFGANYTGAGTFSFVREGN